MRTRVPVGDDMLEQIVGGESVEELEERIVEALVEDAIVQLNT